MVEIWGGVECTVNRIGDQYCDQILRSGHEIRFADLEQFAALGIRTLRYPILWERTQPLKDHSPQWQWADERLAELRRLDIRPVVGLVHHGSGPAHVSLVSDEFSVGLADYARCVAERYPWINDYTPVNEPLTTARFSGLYGHWYPHERSLFAFAKALLVECRATVLAMRAIREVNPQARLVQTEDIGHTYSTPALRYQADFENERRWLTWDLLCGAVNQHHPMRHFLCYCGIRDEDIEWFQENPCPPDVLGINSYVTSPRFLDEHLERYPPWTHGGNGKQSYADIEAVRVLEPCPVNIGALISEAWERYHLPIAITECHLGCTPDEQIRWLWETYQAAKQQHAKGVDVRALTVWALLGAFDWNSLLTRDSGHYEPGVFALQGSPLQPHPTPLAGLVRALALQHSEIPSEAHSPGWWRCTGRLLYPPVCRATGNDIVSDSQPRHPLSAMSSRRHLKKPCSSQQGT